MRPRLLRVDADPAVFTHLFDATARAGLRCGWLDLSAGGPALPVLEAAAAVGAVRAVAAGGQRVQVLKPLRGEVVLRDVLREHFSGCHLVLVRGEVEAPNLAPAGEDWSIARGEARATLSSEELAGRVRRPSWWARWAPAE